MKDVFTTGQAAKICKISQQMIIRYVDTGKLKGFRIPGSTHRRILRADLIQFMKDNNLSTADLDGEPSPPVSTT